MTQIFSIGNLYIGTDDGPICSFCYIFIHIGRIRIEFGSPGYTSDESTQRQPDRPSDGETPESYGTIQDS